jgi:hypothetical protein
LALFVFLPHRNCLLLISINTLRFLTRCILVLNRPPILLIRWSLLLERANFR